jgi:hypothetical protein
MLDPALGYAAADLSPARTTTRAPTPSGSGGVDTVVDGKFPPLHDVRRIARSPVRSPKPP